MKDIEVETKTSTTENETPLTGNYRVRIKGGFTEQKEAIVASSDVEIEWNTNIQTTEDVEKLKQHIDYMRRTQKEVSQQVFEDHRDRARAYTNEKLMR